MEKARYLKEAQKNIQDKSWEESVGTALGITSSICQDLGGFVPGLSILGGACRMGSTMLKPVPTIDDLNRTTQALSEELKGVKKELQDVDLILSQTFEIVKDVRYKDGIEMVDSSFKTYLNGSKNIEQTLSHMESYIFEMQSLAEKSLNPIKVRDYLQIMMANSSTVTCQKTVESILLTKMKYLTMTLSFYFAKEDFERVGIEFQNFNDEYQEICLMFEKEFNYILKPGIYPSDPIDAIHSLPEEETRKLIGKFKNKKKFTL